MNSRSNVLFTAAGAAASRTTFEKQKRLWLVGRIQVLRSLTCALVLCASMVFPLLTNAAVNGNLRGKVLDPLGSVVPSATVVVLQDGKEIAHATSDAQGAFELPALASGQYTVRVEAVGFAAQTLPVVIEPGQTKNLPVSLQIGPLLQSVVVSATGTPLPESQVGASVSVIDGPEIDTLNKLDVLENLRLIPGAQIAQTGQRGGYTYLFLGGGDSDFTKVLIDGIPANSIGGAIDFSTLSNTGIGNLEVLRGSNSVLYGSDAMSGVINLTSKRGTTEIPELQYSTDGGNFGTMRQDVSLGGAVQKFDYFSEFSRFDTNGNLPNDKFHNATVDTNLGYQINPTTNIRVTARHTATGLGEPNALDFYGIPDDSWSANHNTYVGATLQQQTTLKWHNSLQFAYAQLNMYNLNPTPTGQLDSYGDYLGNPVNICGANGYCTAGQAILDYGYYQYPSAYTDYEARRSMYAQSDYQFLRNLTGVFGFRYEHEDGEGYIRDNYSTVLEGHGNIGHVLFSTFGVGLEHNSFFGFAASPRASIAYYLRRPTNEGFFGETKLKFNIGKGIKEATLAQQGSSLIGLLNAAQITQYNVPALGPEKSRTIDFGFDQRLWKSRALFGVTFFYNDFYNLISYLGVGDLISMGVDPAVATSTAVGGGAYVNANSERTMGMEVDFKTDLGHGFLFQGEYTYLDGLVTKAFGTAVYNPAWPTIPIGMYDPLVGNRPFNRAPHSGSLSLFYNNKKFSAGLTGYMVSRSDTSTFLSDQYYGNTMLLPNRNLEPGYQKFDLSVRYALRSYMSVYTVIENLFDQHYEQIFGYPALPFTIRSGMTFTLGGAKNWWKQ